VAYFILVCIERTGMKSLIAYTSVAHIRMYRNSV